MPVFREGANRTIGLHPIGHTEVHRKNLSVVCAMDTLRAFALIKNRDQHVAIPYLLQLATMSVLLPCHPRNELVAKT